VPKGVQVEITLQAHFGINTENMGQFERTLIIVDEDASVHYVEGCTAPIYSSDSLHSAVVEIIVKKGARCRYTTIQNWSANVYNLRARPGRDPVGRVRRHRAAPGRRRQDGALRAQHLLPDRVQVGGPGGRPHVLPGPGPGAGRRGAFEVHGEVRRAAGGHGQPVRHLPVRGRPGGRRGDGHEASVSKISEDQLFYLMSRGMTEDEAAATIVRGFVEPIARELPMEYALELNRLIELQMEGAVG
jgi:Fe-S cluster assembly protein SufB